MPPNCQDVGNGMWLCEDYQLAPEVLGKRPGTGTIFGDNW